VRNTRGTFFAGRVGAIDPALKIEDDHELVWMSPQEAARGSTARRTSSPSTWLRLRQRA
jgi:hypothetical protein